jgi:hypothetical protein
VGVIYTSSPPWGRDAERSIAARIDEKVVASNSGEIADFLIATIVLPEATRTIADKPW